MCLSILHSLQSLALHCTFPFLLHSLQSLFFASILRRPFPAPFLLLLLLLLWRNLLHFLRAYWVSESVIAWNADVGGGFCCLLARKDASLSFANCKIQGVDLKIKLQEDTADLPTNTIWCLSPTVEQGLFVEYCKFCCIIRW